MSAAQGEGRLELESADVHHGRAAHPPVPAGGGVHRPGLTGEVCEQTGRDRAVVAAVDQRGAGQGRGAAPSSGSTPAQLQRAAGQRRRSVRRPRRRRVGWLVDRLAAASSPGLELWLRLKRQGLTGPRAARAKRARVAWGGLRPGPGVARPAMSQLGPTAPASVSQVACSGRLLADRCPRPTPLATANRPSTPADRNRGHPGVFRHARCRRPTAHPSSPSSAVDLGA